MKLDKDTKELGTKIIRTTILIIVILAAFFVIATLGPVLIKGL